MTTSHQAPIQPADWNFDSIPERQLIACCYWEYARESAFLRAFKHRCVEANGNPKPLNEAFELCGKDARLVLSIGAVANSFLLGFGFQPDDPKNPATVRKADLRPPVSGNFPAPWQSLPSPERVYRAELAAGTFPAGAHPFQRASGPDAVNALMFLTSTILRGIPAAPPSALNDLLQRQLAQLNALADPTSTQPGQSRAQCSPTKRGLRTPLAPSRGEGLGERGPSLSQVHGVGSTVSKLEPSPSIHRLDTHSRVADEIALVQIQWGSCSDDEIIDSFRAWLKANRPDPIRPVPAPGHKLKDWRAHLTRLAVMRLLTRFSALQLLDPKFDLVPGLWESNQFSGPTWLDVVKWHDARREARATFHQLFPFLPPATDPLSWPTARKREK